MQPLINLERPVAEVALLTLNRPEKKNALSIALRDAVSDALDKLKDDLALKCVVLTGAGNSFSAGFDLSEFQTAFTDAEYHKKLWTSSDRYHEILLKYPLPTIAAIGGAAMGGGLDTAVLCDIRIASDTAYFGHPEAAFADVVYAPLHDLIGGAAARELCLTGRRIDAAEALRLGLVSEVVPSDRLLDRVLEIAGSIARAPREVLMRTKAKIIARAAITFKATLEL
ncbi:MAG: enoyl-CoA hydratase/isomerase family protein [Alphaproteobacteria bacterium]|nr:enoyl-CoA hydratase/isomerase family protein [Alphaproteobacteria bacterium]